MSGRKHVKKNLIIVTTISMVVLAMIPVGGFIGKKIKNNSIVKSSPLNEYSYYYSLDEFPKYKLEAAEMVNELIAKGVSEEDACMQAIDVTSDKIYADTLEFYDNVDYDWNNDEVARQKDFEKFIARKQK